MRTNGCLELTEKETSTSYSGPQMLWFLNNPSFFDRLPSLNKMCFPWLIATVFPDQIAKYSLW